MRGNDYLVFGDGRLGVEALDVAPRALHDAALRVGGVNPGALKEALAHHLGGKRVAPQVLFTRLPALLLLVYRLLLLSLGVVCPAVHLFQAFFYPLLPLLLVAQLLRDLVASLVRAVDAVLLGVHALGFGEYAPGQFLELLCEGCVRAVRVQARGGLDLGAVYREYGGLHHIGLRAQREHLAEKRGDGLFVVLSESGYGGVVRYVVATYDPEAGVALAQRHFPAGRALSQATGVDDERHHHPWVVSRRAPAVCAVGRVKLGQVHPLDGVYHEQGEISLGKPVSHVLRKEELLVAVQFEEVVCHVISLDSYCPLNCSSNTSGTPAQFSPSAILCLEVYATGSQPHFCENAAAYPRSPR